MATQNVFRNRVKSNSVFTFSFTGSVASGTAVNTLDLPPGAYRVAAVVRTAANNHGITITAAPYVDPAQVVAASAFSLSIPAGGAAGPVTYAATSTTRVGHVAPITGGTVQSNDTPVLLYGMKFTMATTAASGSGTWALDVVAVEV